MPWLGTMASRPDASGRKARLYIPLLVQSMGCLENCNDGTGAQVGTPGVDCVSAIRVYDGIQSGMALIRS